MGFKRYSNNLWVLTWISILSFISSLNAVSTEYKFHHIGLEQGLSQITARCLHQDSIGRIWIGTREGLNCFDGTSMTTFYSESSDPSTLLGHMVYKILQQDNKLWILTNLGISSLNLVNLKVERYSTGAANDIVLFNDQLIVAKNSGIYLLNQSTKILESTGWNIPMNLNSKCLMADNSGNFWIGTADRGVFIYSPKTQTVRQIHNATANCFFEDSNRNYWIGTEQSGVYVLNKNFQETEHFRQDKTNGLIHNNIRQIEADHKGNIWIGTFLGVTIYNPNEKSFQHLIHKPDDPNSISHNSIFAIYKGLHETMWLGTYFGGVSYCNLKEDIYTRYYSPGSEKNQLNFPVVGKIKEDKYKNIWIGTEGGGLNFYNRATGEFTYYNHENKDFRLSGNNVKDFCFDENNNIYVTIHLGGLNKINTRTGEVEHFQHDKSDTSSIHTDRVTDIIRFGNNYLVGGFGGVSLFNPETERFKPFKIGYTGIVNCIFKDSSGNLWFGTENNGVYKYHPETNQGKWFLHHQDESSSISSNNICQVFEDAQSNLWFATLGGGLCKFNREAETFTTYSKANNQLLSDFVFGIQQSKLGHLWVSTRKGLTKFDAVNQRFFHLDFTSGFPLKELNLSSLLLTDDGELFIGGIDGLVSMKEAAVLGQPESSNLHFSRFFVNNKEVMPFDQTNILDEVINNTREITLHPKHTTFSIQYSAPDFSPSSSMIFQHKLEGYDIDWIESKQFLGNYTNVRPGTYHFTVRSLNAFDLSEVAGKSITITVKPPIYKTWYALLFYGIVLLTILLWLQYINQTKLRLDHQIELEQKEKESIKTINQAKLRFFTNISHELKTPLTLIIGSLEMIMEEHKLSPKYYNPLRVAYNNAFRLKSQVSELIDFRKQEQGHFKLKIGQHDIVHFLNEIFHSFVEFANYKHIAYSHNLPEKEINIWMDPNQMQKVFFNLIANAFKYVEPTSGNIQLELNDLQDSLEIRIIDNGVGIPEDQSEFIFDRFYQVENNPSNRDGHGSGIGLALSKGIVEAHSGTIGFKSEKGQGTIFFVCLKKGSAHYKPEDFVEQTKDNAQIFISEYQPAKMIDSGNSTTPEGDKPTILIAEDTEEVRDMLSNVFNASYMVVTAKDGAEAMEKAIDKQPDIIISDVMMPKMSGTELCVKIKRNIQTCHIPVILLTARTALNYKLEGIETGADDYIEKPFNVKLLKARVQNLLQNRKILHKKFSSDPGFEVKSLAVNQLDKKILEKASQIVQENLAEPNFNVDDFASAMGMGRTKLFEKIKGLTGQTPNEFIQTIRMNKASELLINSPELTVSEVAYTTGFNSPKYFSSYFRRHFGVSPSQYAQKLN